MKLVRIALGTVFAIVALSLVYFVHFLVKDCLSPLSYADKWKAGYISAGMIALSAVVGVVAAFLVDANRPCSARKSIDESLQGLNATAGQLGKIADVLQPLPDSIAESCKPIERFPVDCRECATEMRSAVKQAGEIGRLIFGEMGDSLIRYDDLVNIEENKVDVEGDIWVLTSALELETTKLKKAIRSNLEKKRIKYTYLVPDTLEFTRRNSTMRKLAIEWQRDCKLTSDEARTRINAILVPAPIAYMTVIVYNPYNRPTVVVKFPLNKEFEERTFPLFYHVAPENEVACNEFKEALEQMILDSARKEEERKMGIKPFELEFS